MKAIIQRQRSLFVAVGVVALVVLALGFLVGRISAPTPRAVAAPTATRLVPTPTPRLLLQTPHVLASFLTPPYGSSCASCYSLSFTSNGPFDLIGSCQPFGAYADSLPTYTLQLYDGNGHLVDTVQQSCGDPNTNTVATAVIPENLPAGKYMLEVSPFGGTPMGVLILDAAPHGS